MSVHDSSFITWLQLESSASAAAMVSTRAATALQEEKLGKIGPLLESHQRRDKALVELERLDEVRPKVFGEGGYVNYKEVRCCRPAEGQAPCACLCATLLDLI